MSHPMIAFKRFSQHYLSERPRVDRGGRQQLIEEGTRKKFNGGETHYIQRLRTGVSMSLGGRECSDVYLELIAVQGVNCEDD